MTRDREAVSSAAEERPAGSVERRFAGEVVLVTGFPGYRAQPLVQLLAEREPEASLWFVVPPRELEAAARALANTPLPREQLRLIPGEPCAIDLGLSRQTYAELAQRVDRWFALYQTTEQQAPRELCFRVNVGSAREVAEFSKVAERLAHVAFLSNAAVFGDHHGEVAEDELAIGQSFRSPAAESLALAEAVLRRNLAHVPVSVARTPQVLGARGQDAPVRSSGLHRLLATVATSPAVLPMPPGANRPVLAVPADFVAEALYLVSALGTRGRAYHFAEAQPPTLAEVLEQAATFFGKHLEQAFDARAFGRLLLSGPAPWLGPQHARALAEGIEGPRLLTRDGDRLLDRAGIRAPALRSYLDVVLRETEDLRQTQRLDERRAGSPFEVVA